ncbi:hypothetical protein [Streptomyces sp. NPDC007991]|uniref:hypothetical protein n=1 Tax=Streptomyces sp. NPDC007991 TaxID=3364803 RepID=UPI0036E2DBFF
MRPLYVPVRLAATVVAVAAAAGCMSVGDDAGGSAKPSHSTGRHGGEAPDGGSATSGGGTGFGATADAERGHGKDKKGKKGKNGGAGEPVSPGVSPSAVVGPSAPGRDTPGRPAGPTPKPPAPPTPTRTAEPEPTPTPTEVTTSPEPTDKPEPSSSAHEPPGPQLEQREPAPEAGAPA